MYWQKQGHECGTIESIKWNNIPNFFKSINGKNVIAIFSFWLQVFFYSLSIVYIDSNILFSDKIKLGRKFVKDLTCFLFHFMIFMNSYSSQTYIFPRNILFLDFFFEYIHLMSIYTNLRIGSIGLFLKKKIDEWNEYL